MSNTSIELTCVLSNDAGLGDLYSFDEMVRLEEIRPHLMVVSFRVRDGHDAFPIRILLDRREIQDEEIVRAAKARLREIVSSLQSAVAGF